jgi:hypothetical protein
LQLHVFIKVIYSLPRIFRLQPLILAFGEKTSPPDPLSIKWRGGEVSINSKKQAHEAFVNLLPC